MHNIRIVTWNINNTKIPQKKNYINFTKNKFSIFLVCILKNVLKFLYSIWYRLEIERRWIYFWEVIIRFSSRFFRTWLGRGEFRVIHIPCGHFFTNTIFFFQKSVASRLIIIIHKLNSIFVIFVSVRSVVTTATRKLENRQKRTTDCGGKLLNRRVLRLSRFGNACASSVCDRAR